MKKNRQQVGLIKPYRRSLFEMLHIVLCDCKCKQIILRL